MAWHPFRNVGLKFAALGLSVLLWVTVSGQQVERSVPVRVYYGSAPAGLLLTGDRYQTVTVHLKGSYNQISGLGPDAVNLVVDLADAMPGENVLALGPRLVRAPLGIEVTRVEPSTVTVTLEQATTAFVLVSPTLQGQPAAGSVTAGVRVEPSRVPVIGPESRLRAAPTVATDPVSIDGATASVTRTVNVVVSDPELRLGDIRTVRVTVTILRGSTGGG